MNAILPSPDVHEVMEPVATREGVNPEFRECRFNENVRSGTPEGGPSQLGQFGDNIAWCHALDGHPLAAVLVLQVAAELGHEGLGAGVHGEERAGGQGREGTDVNDGSTASGQLEN